MNRALVGAAMAGCVSFAFGCGSDKNDDGSFASSASNGSAGGGADNGGGVIVTNGGGIGNTSGSAGASGGMNSGSTCNGTLTGVIRDFHTAFPDMEVQSHDSSKCYCDDRQIVTDTLGDDMKPVYAGDPDKGTTSTTGKANFDQWYRDTDQNVAISLQLPFTDPDGDGVFSYVNNSFFPIDDQLFMDEGDPHNYHFTFELHTQFTYTPGDTFRFHGDDDVFVYINGKRVVNLGGVHVGETADVSLDTLGLQSGQTYPLDFFFAERHVTLSEFELDTTIRFIDCGSGIHVN